jgi:tetratricopeptide (TPR) repeat protein
MKSALTTAFSSLAIGLLTLAFTMNDTVQTRLDPLMATVERDARGSDPEAVLKHMDAVKALKPESSDRRGRALALYSSAHIQWRALSLMRDDRDRAEATAQAALASLDEAVRLDANLAEAHALQASLLGQRIGRAPHLAMSLSGRVSAARSRARAIDAANPRVDLIDGMGAFFTPAEYGGGLDEAERLIRSSLALFAKEPRGKAWPNWGRFDAHLWLGQTLAAKGDVKGARGAYTQALAEGPESAWIKQVLLPQLDGKAETRK